MTDDTSQHGQSQSDPPQTGHDQQQTTTDRQATAVTKKTIPHPDEVHPSKHDLVMAHVAEQFGFTKTHQGHYEAEVGSVRVEPLSPGRDRVTFVRTHDPHAPAEPHGLNLGQ